MLLVYWRGIAAPVALAAVVLSHVLLSTVSAAPIALPVRFGAAGDSLTDEYHLWRDPFYNSPTALNWVEQMALYRATEVDFGTWGPWDPVVFPGGPRYTGYEYNYARAGATSTTLLGEGQHTGLASQPVEIVYLGIGTNDFVPLTDPLLGTVDNYTAIYNGGDPSSVINQLVANFTTALDTIAGPADNPNGVRMIVGNVGDWGALPQTEVYGFTNPVLRQNVTNAVMDANQQIRAITLSRGIPIVDVFELLNLQAGPDPLIIGGVTVGLGAAPFDDQSFFTLPDRIHPGTLAQGLLANAIMQAANSHYGAGLTPFTDQELLAHANLVDPNGGTVTSHFDISPFVQNVPEPGGATAAIVGAMMLCMIGWSRRHRFAVGELVACSPLRR